INKSSIGQTQLRTVRIDKSADFTVAPASMHGAKPGGPMYFMESTNDFLKLDPISYHMMTWANPLVASSFMSDNELPVPAYDFPDPPDKKGGLPVDTNDFRTLSVAWRDNILVVANTASVDASLVAKAHWYQWQTNASNPASIPLLLQAGVIDPGPGVSTF